MMSESSAVLGDVTAARKPARIPEHRKVERCVLHDVRGTLAWREEIGEVAWEVSVLNISGAGAGVLSEHAPEVGQSLRLSLHGGSARMEPIEAQLVDTSLDASGRQVLHLRFICWVPLDAFLQKHRERRLWERYPARATRASLTWIEGGAKRTIPCDLLNISGGGAALASDVLPPPGVPIWFQLVADTWKVDQFAPVEARLVTTSEDPSGMKIARLQFVEPCPMDLFERAVNGPE